MTRDELNALIQRHCDVALLACEAGDTTTTLAAVEEIFEVLMTWSRQQPGYLSQAEIKRVVTSPHLRSLTTNLVALRKHLLVKAAANDERGPRTDPVDSLSQ
jgi:hypothetical protein